MNYARSYYADAMLTRLSTTSSVRLIGRVHFANPLGHHIRHDLREVLTCSLFDRSDEQDHRVLKDQARRRWRDKSVMHSTCSGNGKDGGKMRGWTKSWGYGFGG